MRYLGLILVPLFMMFDVLLLICSMTFIMLVAADGDIAWPTTVWYVERILR